MRLAGRVVLAVLVGCCLAGVPLSAAEEALLPPRLAESERDAWSRVDARELEKLAGGEAAVLREYGAMGAERAEYTRGTSRWQVTLFHMQDRTGAFGAHSLLRGMGPVVPLGEAGTRTAVRYAFYQGNSFILADALADEASLGALAQHLAGLPEHVASLPILGSFLPTEGLLRGSEQYFLGPQGLARVFAPAPGDWVGFAYGAEVQLARYRLGGGEAVLLLISYPTPQIAGDRMRDFGRLLNLNGSGDPTRPPAFARRLGTLVAFAAGPKTNEAAAQLFDGIRYETKVSWSDPSDPRPQPNWAHTLLNIFVGTGVILLFTLVSGVAYGLFRLGMKHFFPGLIFDRPSDSDMIIFKLDVPSHK